MSFGSFLTLVQLASQSSISFERLLVVRFPIEYRARYSRTGRKVFATTLWLASAILGIGIGGSSVYFYTRLVLAISTWVCYSGTLFIQVLSYAFIIKEMRANTRKVVEMAQPGALREAAMEQARRKQEKHLNKLATGITLSFMVCNLPMMAFVGMYEVKMESQTCYTNEGMFYTFSLGFVCLNMLFDPIWYFFYNNSSFRR